jgi:hypothetical protein
MNLLVNSFIGSQTGSTLSDDRGFSGRHVAARLGLTDRFPDAYECEQQQSLSIDCHLFERFWQLKPTRLGNLLTFSCRAEQ